MQAAYAHHAFTAVHPFADGNGRVAHALASVFLYRAVGVPLVVFAEERESYLSVLQRADAGDHQAFVDLTFDAALDSVALVTDTLRAATQPGLADEVQRVKRALTTPSGLSVQELHAVAARLLDHTQATLRKLADGLTLPPCAKSM